jgi:curved DNA-binding protein
MRGKNHYRTLGISPQADEKQIRAAYLALVKQYHPDTGEGSSAEKFNEIQQAYVVLRDPEQRAAYDRERLLREPTRWSRPATPGFRQGGVSHIDLRDFSSRRAIEFSQRSQGRGIEVDPDPWRALFSLFFEDLFF